MAWFYLLLAIIFELAGTTALKFSEGFSKFYWTLGMAVSYGFAFYLLSIVVKTIPLGIAYARLGWSWHTRGVPDLDLGV